MKIKNNLGQSFKTGGTAMGSTLFFAGMMICYYLSLAGLVLVVLGALAAFTNERSVIDTDKRFVKYTTWVAGIIPIMKKVNFEKGMSLKMKKVRKGHSISTRGSSKAYFNEDFRIILLDKGGSKIMDIQKFNSSAKAGNSIQELARLLDMKY